MYRNISTNVNVIKLSQSDWDRYESLSISFNQQEIMILSRERNSVYKSYIVVSCVLYTDVVSYNKNESGSALYNSL